MDIRYLHASIARLPIGFVFTACLLAVTWKPVVANTAPKEKNMVPPGDKTRAYKFDFRSEMDLVKPGLSAYMTIQRIDGSSGKAIMLLNRHNGDLARPVGLFAATLPKTDALALATAVDSIKWSSLPAATGSDISAAGLSIEYVEGAKIIRRSFNARNGDILNAVTPIMDLLDKFDPLFQPKRAIEVGIERTDAGFKLIIRNVGSGAIMIADPRLPGTGHERPTRGLIKVADAPENVDTMSLHWDEVRLKPIGDSPHSITLAPGKTYTVESVPWTPPHRSTYSAEASWIDYAGPEVDEKLVMPMIPEPEHADDSRPYAIRGAAFSSYLNFKAGKVH